jgi:hypothetical protein
MRTCGAKWLVDGLVKAGLLVDDSDQWAAVEYEQHLSRAYPQVIPFTAIFITYG